MTLAPANPRPHARAAGFQSVLSGLDAVTIAVGASALLAIAFVLMRPLIPVDETRYLTVAWEMRQSHDWLVPHLNGQAYSHKPPLIFWLINAVWSVFGPNEIAARLVPAAFLPLCVWLASILGRRIGGVEVGGRTALITASILIFAVSSTLVMFDALLTAATLTALIGLSLAADGKRVRGFAVFGGMIGLGVLIKGPAVLIHVLPAALLAPLWTDRRQNWFAWYAGVTTAIAIGAAIALAWALPAARAGGPEFGQMILWGQTTGRMVKAFDHARPAWYYLMLAPALLLPWSVSRNLWGLFSRRTDASPGVAGRVQRLPFIAAAGTFVLFSLVSGKQIHYVAPAYPCLSVGLAVLLSRRPNVDEPGFAVLTFLFGLTLVLIYPLDIIDEAWSPYAFAVGGAVSMTLSVLVWRLRHRAEMAALGATVAMALGLHTGSALGGLAVYDPAWVTPWLVDRPADAPIAVAGDYAGEYGYAARLTRPVQVIAPEAATAWMTDHPGGVLVYSYRGEPAVQLPATELHPYRRGMLGVWLAHSPSIRESVDAPAAR